MRAQLRRHWDTTTHASCKLLLPPGSVVSGTAGFTFPLTRVVVTMNCGDRAGWMERSGVPELSTTRTASLQGRAMAGRGARGVRPRGGGIGFQTKGAPGGPS